MAADVFEEDEARPALHDDAPDVWPQVPRVAPAEPVAGGGERLARIARSEDVHASTPASAVEGGKVVPDRSRCQGLIRHPGHESGRGEGFPLDVTYSVKTGFCDEQPEVEPAGAGAQGEPADAVSIRKSGTYSHAIASRCPFDLCCFHLVTGCRIVGGDGDRSGIGFRYDRC